MTCRFTPEQSHQISRYLCLSVFLCSHLPQTFFGFLLFFVLCCSVMCKDTLILDTLKWVVLSFLSKELPPPGKTTQAITNVKLIVRMHYVESVMLIISFRSNRSERGALVFLSSRDISCEMGCSATQWAMKLADPAEWAGMVHYQTAHTLGTSWSQQCCNIAFFTSLCFFGPTIFSFLTAGFLSPLLGYKSQLYFLFCSKECCVNADWCKPRGENWRRRNIMANKHHDNICMCTASMHGWR